MLSAVTAGDAGDAAASPTADTFWEKLVRFGQIVFDLSKIKFGQN